MKFAVNLILMCCMKNIICQECSKKNSTQNLKTHMMIGLLNVVQDAAQMAKEVAMSDKRYNFLTFLLLFDLVTFENIFIL